jgi:hypothetical protein
VATEAVERRREQNERALARFQGADERFLERAAAAQVSREPAVCRYMIEALMEAPDDPDDPVEMTQEERGTLFLVLQVVIDVLHDAREGAESRLAADPQCQADM